MRAKAKMIVKGGGCTTGCDERELCVGVCTPRIVYGPRGTWEGDDSCYKTNCRPIVVILCQP